jgi:hypothetical protein
MGFKGAVRLNSPDKITINSSSVHWVNQETTVSTEKLSVAAISVSAVADNMTLHGGVLRMISRSLDVIGDRMSRNVQTLVSLVRGNEVRQSNQLSEQVINTRLQKSKQTVIDAKNDLRINAERIHMG